MKKFALLFVIIATVISAGSYQNIWSTFKKTRTSPYDYSSSREALVIRRTAAWQDYSLISPLMTIYDKNKQFNGLFSTTLRADTIAIDTTTADSVWVRSGASAPDTLWASLEVRIGGKWVVLRDTVEWRRADYLSRKVKLIILPSMHDSLWLFNTSPDTVDHVMDSKLYDAVRSKINFDDAQDSAYFDLIQTYDWY